MKRSWVCCLLVLLPVTVLPAPAVLASETQTEPVPEVSLHLSKDMLVGGRFHQSKEQAGLPNPLQSQGEFLFWRDRGVHWSTETPVQQITVYRSDKTLQSIGDSGEVKEQKSRSERTFRRILLDIFSFDEAQIERQFEQHWQVGEQQRWHLLLQPKTMTLKRALQQVTLSGGEFVDTLRIVDAKGLALEIDFSEQHRSGQGLDAKSCQALFFYSPEQCQ
ncbi:MAG: outer membrane lipoprotein carrier protein LolA [Halioglobus sp.]